MREQVTIVLNEREPTKARAAEALQAALRDCGITAVRIPISETIDDVVVERRPVVAVLDYLLGDFSTGLDILSRLKELDEEERCTVFFLTDEPSVPVAVEAMRLGALDYFALDQPQAIQKLTRAIEQALHATTMHSNVRKSLPSPLEPASLDDLVAESKASSAAVRQLQVLAEEHAPLLILQGEPGVGKRTWAHIYRTLRTETSPHKLVDLRTSDASLAEITGHSPRRVGPKLGFDLNLSVLHADEDDGELLEFIIANHATWWGEGSESYLTVCVASSQVAHAWTQAIPRARLLKIPCLAERTEDIAALIQRFTNDAAAISEQRLKPFDASILRWMAGLDWPGNIRQLRTVTIESALRLHHDKALAPKDAVEQQRVLWQEECSRAADADPDSPLTLAHTLELCGHRYRAAAALLGYSTRTLLAKLEGRNGGLS